MFYFAGTQTQLELESIKSVGSVVVTEEPGETRDSGELQATLQLVKELKAQLQSVREEMSEREKRHQAEVETLGTAGEHQESDDSRTAGWLLNTQSLFCYVHIIYGVPCFSTHCLFSCLYIQKCRRRWRHWRLRSGATRRERKPQRQKVNEPISSVDISLMIQFLMVCVLC